MIKSKNNILCPSCQSNDIAEIIYGMSAFSQQLMKEIKEGKAKLGGCCIRDDNPDYRCNKCGKEWKILAS